MAPTFYARQESLASSSDAEYFLMLIAFRSAAQNGY